MDASLPERIQDLGDLELAILLAKVAGEHCIFATASNNVTRLQEEIGLTCVRRFGEQPAVVECSPKTTVDEFNEAILLSVDDSFDHAMDRAYHGVIDRSTLDVKFDPVREPSPGRLGSVVDLDNRRAANTIIATGLDVASESVQVQVFELLRSRRIFTRSAMHAAPKDLLVIAVMSKPDARLTRHLNDLFCFSHYHAEEDGLPNVEQEPDTGNTRRVSPEDISHLQNLTKEVSITHEIAQYLHNVVLFLRTSRYVQAGVTATATRKLRILSVALAPLHNLDYVPPSLVALAARKIYAHRLVLATAKNEKSLLWGSDPRAIRNLLEGVTVEDVIEDVLGSLESPL